MVIFQPAMRLTTQSLINHYVARESLSDTCFFIAGIINPLCFQIWRFEQIKRMQMSSYVQKVLLWFAHRGQLLQLSIFILKLPNASFCFKNGEYSHSPRCAYPTAEQHLCVSLRAAVLHFQVWRRRHCWTGLKMHFGAVGAPSQLCTQL